MRKHSSELRGFGRVITGSVHDCNKRELERQLQLYDSMLYIKWNTDKLGGQGCWEIRRKPTYLTNIYHGEYQGRHIYTSERIEQDLIHHVLDAPILHYGLVGKIKAMDLWQHKDFNSHLEGTAAEYEARERKRAREEMLYDIKQHKREWRDMLALVQSGVNPGAFIKGIKG